MIATVRQTASVRVPRATYRLQFHAGFTLRDAAALIPYLAELGVSDLYASPLGQARAGSTHGYDVCDPNRLNPELGTEADLDDLVEALQRHRLGLVLDIVPNHMGVGDPANRWWWDVLEHGQESAYAPCFDIDWDSPRPGLRGRVLLPVLGATGGEVLERGELRLMQGERGLVLRYYDQEFPVSPSSWLELLAGGAEGFPAAGREEATAWLRRGREALEATGDPEERGARWARWKDGFGRALQAGTGLGSAWAEVLLRLDVGAGGPGAAERLHALLRGQHYRLAWWRLGLEQLNYRRFFDITHLAGLRVEVPEVFLRSHEWVAHLCHRGVLTGLRIDHPDGLWNPAEYLRRLQRLVIEAAPDSRAPVEADASGRGLYVVVEKILCPGETLAEDWPVHGTTGYEFLNLVNGVFVPTDGAEAMERVYEAFTGRAPVFADEVHRNKRKVLERSLVAEVDNLTLGLERLLAGSLEGGDYGLRVLREALVELVANFPVYRAYAEPGRRSVPVAQQAWVASAVRLAAHRNPQLPGRLLGLLGDLLTLRWPDPGHAEASAALSWVMRFQQLTGPAMAKGLEDTTFYTFNRLISLNDVGGHPDDFGVPVQAFHEANAARAARWPGSLLATSTHDTKRGEDVRARLNVLAEMPEEWERALTQFRSCTASLKHEVAGGPAPSANDEYFFYQTLVGLGVPDREAPSRSSDYQDRVQGCMLKAIREAKEHTSWTDPAADYEAAVRGFVAGVLDPVRGEPFLEAIGRLARRVAWFGRFNSLAQTLLKLTVPGVPDLYQGSELWDLSLVDPDNRRPVDFRLRQEALQRLRDLASRGETQWPGPLGPLVKEGEGAAAKLWTIWRALDLRCRVPELWAEGEYQPCEVLGHQAEHLVAFVRAGGEASALVVVPRLPVGLTGGAERVPVGPAVWSDARVAVPAGLESGEWKNWLTGETLPAAREMSAASLLPVFPVALLVRGVDGRERVR